MIGVLNVATCVMLVIAVIALVYSALGQFVIHHSVKVTEAYVADGVKAGDYVKTHPTRMVRFAHLVTRIPGAGL